MIKRPRKVTVFGGTGFLGRYVVRRLAAEGDVVSVAVRHPEEGLFLKPAGNVAQVVLRRADVTHEASVRAAVADADAVVNLVGILYERGRRSFSAIHRDGAALVARAALDAGARRLVHVSAIGADRASTAAYAKSKAEGEAAVRAAFPGATIVRPSLIVGPEDDFFNRFAAIARFAPALPLFGGGRTRFQPVYAGDVAEAVARLLDRTETEGRLYELGGPGLFTFAELMEMVLAYTRRRRLLVPVPFAVAKVMAFFAEWLPVPPLTRDQVELLKFDNVVRDGVPGFQALGITPNAIEGIVADYLARYRRGGDRDRRAGRWPASEA